MIKLRRKNKYNNNRTKKGASKKERRRYPELLLLEKAGKISQLEKQKRFILQNKFRYRGEAIRAITYTCDYYYFDHEKNRFIIEDVKGFKTAAYKKSKKMVLKMLLDEGDVRDFLET